MAHQAARLRGVAPLLVIYCCHAAVASSGVGVGVGTELGAAAAAELFRNASRYRAAEQWADAAARYREAADKYNHSGSQYELGLLYGQGFGVPQDDGAGMKWLTLAAGQRYASAQTHLAGLFERGNGPAGVAKDEVRALELYRLAASQGYSGAQQNLGMKFNTGALGLAQSTPAALALWEKAASQGCPNAQFSAGLLYYNGRGGVPRDNKRALFWSQLAADAGFAKAKASLVTRLMRCTSACRTDAEAMVRDFKAQDACAASRFNRVNHCNDAGDPAPAYAPLLPACAPCPPGTAPRHATLQMHACFVCWRLSGARRLIMILH